MFHGDRDATVNSVNGDQVIAQAKGATDLRVAVSQGRSASGVSYTRTDHSDEHGRALLEQWVLHGAGHAWSGGSSAGSYTDPNGPDASREMVRFFSERTRLPRRVGVPSLRNAGRAEAIPLAKPQRQPYDPPVDLRRERWLRASTR